VSETVIIKHHPQSQNSGYIVLTFVVIIVSLLTLILSSLLVISVLNTRASIATSDNRIAFYSSEAAINDTFARISKSGYSWPGKNIKITENITINGAKLKLEVDQGNDQNVTITISSQYNQIIDQFSANIDQSFPVVQQI